MATEPVTQASNNNARHSVKRVLSLSHLNSSDDVKETLTTVVDILQGRSTAGTIGDILKVLNNMPRNFAKVVTEWTDTNQFDLVHNCILCNVTLVLEKLLKDSFLFPLTYMPALNPYAHLAALFGRIECLRLILMYRPLDFFESNKPNHAIKLPNALSKAITNVSSKNALQKRERLRRIKLATEAAEIAMRASVDFDDDDMSLTTYKDGENSKQTARHLRKKIFDKLGFGSTVSSGHIAGNERGSLKTIQIPSVPWTNLAGELKEAEDSAYLNLPAPLPRCHKMKHSVTIFHNIFSGEEPSVICGVGKPVIIKFTQDANLPEISSWAHLSSVKTSKLSQKVPGERFPYIKSGNGLASKTRTIGPEIPPEKPAHLTATANKKMQKIEVGVRGGKKYKEFHLKHDESVRVKKVHGEHDYMHMTPLSIAAEQGHAECVQVVLEMVILKNNPLLATQEPLTLATKARCPAAILLIKDRKFSQEDLHSAVLIAIRDMYPDCLSALLTPYNRKERLRLFDGGNLYHILYSQSLMADYRYELMPEMTRVLIECHENVNARDIPRTFPMYTLINCAFHITDGRQIKYYVDCLKMLLLANANPHFNEDILERKKAKTKRVETCRQPFYSAISCILESARISVDFFENSYWSRVFVRKFINTVETYDQTKGRILNDVLLDYMDSVCQLGLDRFIIRSLLKYGGNPDFQEDGLYAINLYFDNIQKYLAKFEVNNHIARYKMELEDLMIMCRAMTPRCLKDAQRIFLYLHLLNCPIQALPLCRYFAYLINELLKSPPPLVKLAAQTVWLALGRNAKRAAHLPVPYEVIQLILP